jgi:signal peptidase II
MKHRLFWIVAAAGLVADRLTKLWIMQTFVLQEPAQSWALWPGVFHITYVVNTGAAFSMFQGGVWLRWLSLVVSLGLVYLAWKTPRLTRWEQLGYGMVLSGALGNGIDRFLFSHVIDFLDVRLIHFPVFNLADSFISLGIPCLLLALLQPVEGRSREK